MEAFTKIWYFPLFRLGGENAVTVGQVALVLALLLVGIYLSRLIERWLGRKLLAKGVDADGAQTIQRVAFYLCIAAVVLSALSLLQIPITALAFLTGAFAVGVGFGAQNVINNFISGWILMTERPVRIGDFVEIDDSRGVIELIGNRSTRIKRVDGVHLLVPNSQMLERVVVNWTLVDTRIRTSVRVGVAYGSPVRKVEELLQQAVAEHPDTLRDPEAVIIFDDFGDNSLAFDALFWCDVSGERQLRRIRSDLRFRIDDLFAEHGIVIAFPQRDVHLDASGPIPVRIAPAEA